MKTKTLAGQPEGDPRSMKEAQASAIPRKSFFINMFTKDISLEDCILDLIDNSIDGLIRTKSISLEEISKDIFGTVKKKKIAKSKLPLISITHNNEYIEIKDNCGGIGYEDALNDIFNFGHGPGKVHGYLGVYGIGMKRALFKIGTHFHIESKTIRDGFSCDLNVTEWVDKDETLDDWTIPIHKTPGSTKPETAGVRIKIDQLHDEVKMRLNDGFLDENLASSIAKTYHFFLNRYVRIKLNGVNVGEFEIPLGKPEKGEISFEELESNNVNVKIIATIAKYPKDTKPSQEKSGWYVICNGRMVLAADKTSNTGWNIAPMPSWQPKHRLFLGLVFFESENPLALPWTTTKRNLNRESAIYQKVRLRMALAARPVIAFLNKQYPQDVDEEPTERVIAQGATGATLEAVSKKTSVFTAPPPPELAVKPKVQITYEAKKSEIESIRKTLRKPRMGRSRIGRYTFDYFLEQEGLK